MRLLIIKSSFRSLINHVNPCLTTNKKYFIIIFKLLNEKSVFVKKLKCVYGIRIKTALHRAGQSSVNGTRLTKIN